MNEGTPQDGSALVVASASGHEALSIFLLEKGADPNAADGNGITALHYAIQKGLSLLDGVSFQETSVSYLFRPNMVGLVKALLAHGANPNARIVKDPRIACRQEDTGHGSRSHAVFAGNRNLRCESHALSGSKRRQPRCWRIRRIIHR